MDARYAAGEHSTGVFRRHSYGQVFFLSRLRSQVGRYLGGLLARRLRRDVRAICAICAICADRAVRAVD